MSSNPPSVLSWSLNGVTSACAGLAGIGLLELVTDVQTWVKISVGVAGAVVAQVVAAGVRSWQAARAMAKADRAAEAEVQALMTVHARVLLDFAVLNYAKPIRLRRSPNPTVFLTRNHKIDVDTTGGVEAFFEWMKGLDDLVRLGALDRTHENGIFAHALNSASHGFNARFPSPENYDIPASTMRGQPPLSEIIAQKRQEQGFAGDVDPDSVFML